MTGAIRIAILEVYWVIYSILTRGIFQEVAIPIPAVRMYVIENMKEVLICEVILYKIEKFE